MKKYKFTIRGNNYDVDILSVEDDTAEIEVNGSTYLVEIHKQKKSTKTPKLVRPNFQPSSTADKARTSKPSPKSGLGAVKAPLPGTILELKVKEGDTVKEGDPLLIMEAMKMENNINADKAGKIVSVKFNNGDSVLEGDVLVEIEE